ncbi:MAG: hypothetical protein IPL21_13745 [Saprospirales bacterium]|nr:hypothetical protein [Saprospirales bacterium]
MTDFKYLTDEEMRNLSPTEIEAYLLAWLDDCNKKNEQLYQDILRLNKELDNEELE